MSEENTAYTALGVIVTARNDEQSVTEHLAMAAAWKHLSCVHAAMPRPACASRLTATTSAHCMGSV